MAKKVAVKKKTAKAKKAAPVVELDLNDLIVQVQSDLEELVDNQEKFESGNASAGRRIRKHAQLIRKACADIRKAVSNQVNQNK